MKAICQVGASTKTRTDSQYYIGEKGIGFKSVFMVASKVHIQSGPFSFFFEHHHGDSGMGMIAPEYIPPELPFPGSLTRMTLTLLDGLDQPSLYAQFQALPDTILLFLSKLKRITIKILEPETMGFETTCFTCFHSVPTRRATLFRSMDSTSKPPMVDMTEYHVTRKLLKNLPYDEQRAHNTAEVVLAFPLDENSTPIIRSQEVFAYLPIRDYGFSVTLSVLFT